MRAHCKFSHSLQVCKLGNDGQYSSIQPRFILFTQVEPCVNRLKIAILIAVSKY